MKEIFKTHKKLVSIFFTAGYPKLNSTTSTLLELQKNGVDFVEIGVPFSDPMADGETIQESSKIALENEMTLKLLFSQLEEVKNEVNIPIILMGYFNSLLQYGIKEFCKKAKEVGVSGVIFPDLPLEIYNRDYKSIFEEYGISVVFLISPQTSKERIIEIDKATTTFIYAVSSTSSTGKAGSEINTSYLKSLNEMNLCSPIMVGFGIKDQDTFNDATQFSNGGIIGSAFIKHLATSKPISEFTNIFKQKTLTI